MNATYDFASIKKLIGTDGTYAFCSVAHVEPGWLDWFTGAVKSAGLRPRVMDGVLYIDA